MLPTKLPLDEFYRELTKTQQVLNRKHLGWRTLWQASGVFARLALRGQTNFLRNMFHFNSVYDAQALMADHRRPVEYELPQPPQVPARLEQAALYVHGNRSHTHAHPVRRLNLSLTLAANKKKASGASP